MGKELDFKIWSTVRTCQYILLFHPDSNAEVVYLEEAVMLLHDWATKLTSRIISLKITFFLNAQVLYISFYWIFLSVMLDAIISSRRSFLMLLDDFLALLCPGCRCWREGVGLSCSWVLVADGLCTYQEYTCTVLK
jgi:hypothetical protein